MTLAINSVQQLFSQALLQHQNGHLEAAQAGYEAVLQHNPNHVDAHHLLGMIWSAYGQHQQAISYFDRAIALNPHVSDFWGNRALSLGALGQHQDALQSFEYALQHNSNCAITWYNRGNTLRTLDKLEDALSSFEQAIRLRPDYAGAYLNAGNVLQDLLHFEKALAYYERALAINQESAEACNNCGNVLREMGRLDDAIACYDTCLRLNPNWLVAHWNKALIFLLKGNFEVGWSLYEWRWQVKDFPSVKRHFTQPLWLGEVPLNGKTILLHSEQGLGDSLQFCRYLPLVKASGANTILAVERPLARLLGTLDGVDKLISEGDNLPPFDYHCPLLSLPLACGTKRLEDIPQNIPYLKINPEQNRIWAQKLGKKIRPRVGLVWAGGIRPQAQFLSINRRRNIAFALIARLQCDGIDFFSLQKGAPDEEQLPLLKTQYWYGDNFHIHTQDLHDYADTAALINQLDLVISVDTSVAHLAGALGKVVWLLLPANAEWRWLLERTDSPWYASLRLFRQQQYGHWEGVIEDVKQAMLSWAETLVQ